MLRTECACHAQGDRLRSLLLVTENACHYFCTLATQKESHSPETVVTCSRECYSNTRMQVDFVTGGQLANHAACVTLVVRMYPPHS